jgi:hypothetical protein
MAERVWRGRPAGAKRVIRGGDMAGRFRALGWISLAPPLRYGLKEFNEFH